MASREEQLRQLVRGRLDLQWADFADQHPHLAAVIERSVLIEQVIERLTDDPAYQEAMQQAAVDRQTLAVTDRAVAFVDTWIRRVLGL